MNKILKALLFALIVICLLLLFLTGDYIYYSIRNPNNDKNINYLHPEISVVPECDNIESSSRLSCYKKYAVDRRNAQICNNEKSTYDRYAWCHRLVATETGNATICDNTPSFAGRDLCYRDVGAKLLDVSLCTKIIGRTNRGLCYYWIARETKDKSLCNKIHILAYSFPYEGHLRSKCKKVAN